MKAIKILAPYAYFAPEQAASSYIWQNLHEGFAEAGLYCVVYVPTPTRGIDAATRLKYKTEYANEAKFNGCLVIHRFPLYSEGKNPLLRAFRYFLSCGIQFCKCIWAKEAKECNVLFIASTPPILGLTGAFISKLRGIPFVYNLQDIFPDSLVGTGLARKGGLLWKIGRVIENFTYRHADRIIVISEDFKRNIMAKGVPEEKIEVIYNWVDENAVKPVADEDNPLFEEFGISREGFRVVYAGNLGNAQNIELIVDAAARLKADQTDSPQDIRFIIFGTGGLENEIKARKEREGLDNLTILPLQPYERVSQVYGLGNVCIVACKPGLGGAAMPSKTWSIMSAGRPVLASFDEGELKNVIDGETNGASLRSEGSCGIFTPAGDTDAFVAAITALAADKSRCEEMGRNGRQFILANLTKEVGTRKYVDVIKSVMVETL